MHTCVNLCMHKKPWGTLRNLRTVTYLHRRREQWESETCAHTHKYGVPCARGEGDKMEVMPSGCRVGMRGHEEKPHSAQEKDTHAESIRQSVKCVLWLMAGGWRGGLFYPQHWLRDSKSDIKSLSSVPKSLNLDEDVCSVSGVTVTVWLIFWQFLWGWWRHVSILRWRGSPFWRSAK